MLWKRGGEWAKAFMCWSHSLAGCGFCCGRTMFFLRCCVPLLFLLIGNAHALLLFPMPGGGYTSSALGACAAYLSTKTSTPVTAVVQIGTTRNYACLATNNQGVQYNLLSYSVSGVQFPDCATGEEWSDTAQSCQSNADPCELLADMCSGSQGKTSAFSLSGKKTGVSFTCMSPLSFGADSLPGCTKGCMAQVGGFTTAFQSDDGSWMTQGTAKYSGSTCDPSVINDLNSEADPEYEPEENPETSNPPDPSCPGGFKGEVNGVSVCVPPKGSSGLIELEEKDNGDGTKTDTKTELKCENGKCEVTKTSTTTNTSTGGTVSSSSVTTTVDKSAYCSQNKTAAACKNEKGEEDGNGKFGGSCSAGFTCEGDALQCAIAKEQHKRACELHVNESPESKLYEAAKAKTGKATDDLPGNETIALTDRIDTSSALGAGYCPLRDITVDAFGFSKVLPLSDNCEKIGYVKIFFISFCLLLAVWIVFGRK